MDYQIVHAIEGRIRLKIAELATHPGFAPQLQGLVESMNFVTHVRINPLAQTIIITYKPKLITLADLQARLAEAIAQIMPPPPPASKAAKPAAQASSPNPPDPLEADPWADPPEPAPEQNSSSVRETLESLMEQVVGTEASKSMLDKADHVGQEAAQAAAQVQDSLIKLGETTMQLVGEAVEVIANKTDETKNVSREYRHETKAQ
jgi:hypothetical protein